MSTWISLTGKVVVVTGAGRGLGRAYARALAERGAQVVVNDLGTDLRGTGSDPGPAAEIVAEILAAGGSAVADGNDIATPSGARAVIERARAEFGRVDVLVNNAGVHLDRPFTATTVDQFESLWRVHVAGSIHMTQAVWPLMVEQGGGRVVMTESAAGLFGVPGQSAYSAAKGAVHGLMRALAGEGAAHGIVVNSIAPGGYSRMVEAGVEDASMREQMQMTMPPELVAPVIVWMASDLCVESGQVFSAWGGRVSRVVLGGGEGLLDRQITPESVAAGRDAIMAADRIHEPAHAFDEVAHWAPKLFGG